MCMADRAVARLATRWLAAAVSHGADSAALAALAVRAAGMPAAEENNAPIDGNTAQ